MKLSRIAFLAALLCLLGAVLAPALAQPVDARNPIFPGPGIVVNPGGAAGCANLGPGTINVCSQGGTGGTIAINGTPVGGGITIPTAPLLAGNGSVLSSVTPGTTLNITGSTLDLAAQSANTLLGALTATTPSGLPLPSCSGASNALIWTTGTGFGCNTISGGGSPGGSTGQVQYNNSGAFGGLPVGTSGVSTILQTDSGGLLAASVLPFPTASTLGGVQSIAQQSGQFIQYIDTSGVPHLGTPAGGGNVSTSGTPAAGQVGVWTSATGIQGVAATGTGSPVLATSPALVTPALGTPSAVVLTNATGLPLASVVGAGTSAAFNVGTSVLNPGTGGLEAEMPVQTTTGASKAFAQADLYKETRRSNSASAMTDTFPASTTTGLANGTRVTINNVDASASDVITAGAGTTINGGSTDTVVAGRSMMYVYDLPNTQWRRTLNSGTAGLTNIGNAWAGAQNYTGGTQVQGLAQNYSIPDSDAGAPTAGGTGTNAAGDVLTLSTSGGSCTSAPTMLVTAVSTGAVTAAFPQNAGVCSIPPPNPVGVASSSGGGSNAGVGVTFTLAQWVPTGSNIFANNTVINGVTRSGYMAAQNMNNLLLGLTTYGFESGGSGYNNMFGLGGGAGLGYGGSFGRENNFNGYGAGADCVTCNEDTITGHNAGAVDVNSTLSTYTGNDDCKFCTGNTAVDTYGQGTAAHFLNMINVGIFGATAFNGQLYQPTISSIASGSGSQIAVTVSSATGFNTGDCVYVGAAGGTVPVNTGPLTGPGVCWFVSVSSNVLTLLGSTFSGTYTSGGTVADMPGGFINLPIANVVTNGGLIAVEVTSTVGITTGQTAYIQGVTGTGAVAAINCTGSTTCQTLTVSDVNCVASPGTCRLTLQGTTFGGTYVSGGTITILDGPSNMVAIGQGIAGSGSVVQTGQFSGVTVVGDKAIYAAKSLGLTSVFGNGVGAATLGSTGLNIRVSLLGIDSTTDVATGSVSDAFGWCYKCLVPKLSLIIGSESGMGITSSNTLGNVTILSGYQGAKSCTTCFGVTVVGTSVAPTNLVTSNGDLVMGTNGSCDLTASNVNDEIVLCAGGAAAIYTTGANTPATSVTNVTGILNVLGTGTQLTAVGTLGLGGVGTPGIAAAGEGGVFLVGTTGGLGLIGYGSTNDLTLMNRNAATVCDIVSNTTTLTCANMTVSTNVTFSGLTTGTNADFLCLSAGGAVLIQATACTISSVVHKNVESVFSPAQGLADVMALQTFGFRMKDGATPNPDPNYDRPQIGLLAEQVATVDPRLAIYEDDLKTPKSYRQESVIAALVASQQAQQGEIEDLQIKAANDNAELTRLRTRHGGL